MVQNHCSQTKQVLGKVKCDRHVEGHWKGGRIDTYSFVWHQSCCSCISQLHQFLITSSTNITGFSGGTSWEHAKHRLRSVPILCTIWCVQLQIQDWIYCWEFVSLFQMEYYYVNLKISSIMIFLLGTLSWGYDFDSLLHVQTLKHTNEPLERTDVQNFFTKRSAGIGTVTNRSFIAFLHFILVCQKHTFKLWVYL